MSIVKRIATGVMAVTIAAALCMPSRVWAAEPEGEQASAAAEPGEEKPTPAPVEPAETAKLILSVPDDKVLTYESGVAQDFVLNVYNAGSVPATNVEVHPELSNLGDQWPFQIANQKYSETIAEVPAGETVQAIFNFTQRTDIGNGCFKISFVYAGDNDISGNQAFFVNTREAKSEGPESEEQPGEPEPEPELQGDPGYADAGGISNGGSYYSGGGSSGGGSSSVPRVIVTGFSTDPGEVKAGSNFNLIIHLKNTSKSTKVSNMLFDLHAPTAGSDEQTTAPAFLPASGSSSIFLDGIAAGGAADISIQLNAKSDLLQKPYSIDLAMKYEDSNAAQVEGSSSISIPVKQDARFEFSEFEISPESIEMGAEANVMCSLYNLGRVKLYNVKAVFEGAAIEKEETFIGNVESGATASIDAMLTGTKETKGPSKVTMTLSYEDESGKMSTIAKDLKLEVTPAVEEGMPTADMTETSSKGFPVIPVAIGGAALAAIVAAVIVIKKKKKRLMSEEEEGLLDELDGSAEDEH